TFRSATGICSGPTRIETGSTRAATSDDALLAQGREVGSAVPQPAVNLGIVLAELRRDRAHLDAVADLHRRADMRHIADLRIARILNHLAMLHLRIGEHLPVIVDGAARH